jgi:hypothetical protein
MVYGNHIVLPINLTLLVMKI